jgi:site-specific recombinase XerD
MTGQSIATAGGKAMLESRRRANQGVVVETLRHTGVRIEELLELTQLSLRHYTSETTGTLVPLLHRVPSKTDAERLIPMSPELVTVLKDRAWLGEVTALEESLRHLRQRRTDAERQLGVTVT